MNPIIFLICGAFGGLCRVAVGISKSQNFNIDWQKLLMNTGCSLIIGSFAGLIADTNFLVSTLAGYVGIDVIESGLKSLKKW